MTSCRGKRAKLKTVITLEPFLLKVWQIWNDFFKPMILPKNEPMNSTLLLWYLRSTCFCSLFGRNWRHQKDILKLTDFYRCLLYIFEVKSSISRDFGVLLLDWLPDICWKLPDKPDKVSFQIDYKIVKKLSHNRPILFRVIQISRWMCGLLRTW